MKRRRPWWRKPWAGDLVLVIVLWLVMLAVCAWSVWRGRAVPPVTIDYAITAESAETAETAENGGTR